MQTTMDAFHMPTMVKVLLMHRDFKRHLAVFSSEIVSGSDLQPPHELNRLLTTVTLKALNDIKVHDVLCVVFTFHHIFI